MSLQLVANHLAQKGRGPDSTLVHMSNREVAGLQALAKKHGGELSVNPDTGLPEAGFLDSLLPTIAGAGLTYFSGGAINPMMAAGIVGGISALDSKDLGKGLMAGLGAWGGGSMVGGLAGMGLVGEGAAATATTPASEAAMTAAVKDNAYKTAVGEGASKFGNMFASKPMGAIASFGGGSGLNAAKTLFAASAPAIMADQNVKTATPAPNRGMIRPQTFSRQQTYPQQEYAGPVSGERRYFNDSYTAGDPYSAANGGLVALARGGYTNQNIFTPTTPLPENNMYGASRDAYNYLMGVNPTSGGGQTRPYNPYPMEDIRIDDGKNLNPSTPKMGKGRYEFDPITGKYKWIPDPITPVNIAPPVFENPVQRGGGDGYGSSPEGRAERAAYFDKMTPEQREAHAESLRTGVNFISNLMPGAWIPKAADAVQGFFKEQQYKDVMAQEAEKNEADRVKAESDNLLRMIQETNKSIYSPPVEVRTAPVTPESEEVQQRIADTDFSGMDRTSIATAEAAAERAAQTAQDARADRESQGGSRDGGGGVSRSDFGGGARDPAGRDSSGAPNARGGLIHPYANGGIADLYNLGSYSDGGRLLKGPGDGVSDDIPATIGHGQPARLADGEFVIPARIVSELGNGSTDAGARELYKMMDRIQAGRKKTVGKDQVAKNSKSARHLPA